MPSPQRRLLPLVRLAATTLVALALATPASAQFGGLKKRAKAKAAEQAVSKATGEAPAEGAAPSAPGGMIVLTDGVVKQLLAGLKAGQAERDAAAKADTPFGRYKRAEVAYAAAQPKCEAGQQAFYQRAGTDQKMLDKYNALIEKMVAAQGKGDTTRMAIYQDSAMAMQDPSCIVKKPEPPKDYYQAQRDLDGRAEKVEVEASGLTGGELSVIRERADAILRGAPAPGGASPEEKSAVAAKAAELKPLLGIKDQPPAQVSKPAPAPTPIPVSAPVDPKMSAAASNMSACMVKNMERHEAKIEALGKRAEAAEAAGDTQKLMAIADTLVRLQMGGCQ
jgi:hypothetical protein